MDLSSARTPDLTTSRLSVFRRNRSAFACTPLASVKIEDDEMNSSPEYSYTAQDDSQNIEETIQRYIDVGDFTTATYWIDTSYAKKCENDRNVHVVKLAEYIKALTVVREWMRITTLIENNHLVHRHLVFAYYYVNSLFHRKMYTEIIQAPIGGLMDQKNLPVRYPQTTGGFDFFYDSFNQPILGEDLAALDKMAHEMRMFSATMLVYGRTYLLLENREMATQCLTLALFHDHKCLIAEHLLAKYNLISPKNSSRFNIIVNSRVESTSELDPRIQTARAHAAFMKGDAVETLRITSDILEKHGLYMDCMMVHINSLVQLGDAERLFLLGHRLVDAFADEDISWYAVALYYYVCKNAQAAKNFMNKATMMNTGFGEGWLAFGHIMAAEAENEQALNCYYRASRILERHFEPLLYVAIQYCKSGVRLAEQFLNDAAALAPTNPIVVHEQGCLAYNNRDYLSAQRFFEKALKYATDYEEENISMQTLARLPLDVFWEPLINNLGHCCRRLNRFPEAIQYHQKALLMVPRNVCALSSLAMAHACLGDVAVATLYFHRALASQPFNGMVRNAMDKMIQIELDHSHPVSTNGNRHSLDELDNLLSTTTPEQHKAAVIAVAQRKLAASSSKQASSPIQKGIRTTDLAISPILDDSMDVN